MKQKSNSRIAPCHNLNTKKSGIDNRYTDNRLQTPFSEKELERRLRKLYLNHKSIIEETGANNLYLAIGFLHWYDSYEEAQHFRSPLILLPVRLERERGYGIANYRLIFDDEALDTNYSLYEKLKHDFDLSLPLLKDEQSPEEYWKEVNKAIASKSKNGWCVVREMALGMFRFYKQVMWHDLDFKRWPKHSSLLDKNTLKQVLLGTEDGDVSPNQLTHEYDQDSDGPSNKTPKFPVIMDTDSTQYAALVDALTRQTGLVIEGPPGTGKSQTITNLIALALDQGLSVLFVAEKMAALEVVYKRLEIMELGAFCLQLHGLKTSKKELLQSVKERIEHRVEASQKIKHREQELELTKKELIEFSKIMNEVVGPEELPLYKLAWRVELLRQKLPEEFQPIAVSTPEGIKLDRFQEMKNLLDDLGKEWAAIPLEARVAWKGFLPVKYKESKQSKMIAAIENMKEVVNVINTCLLSYKIPDTCPSLCEVSRLLKLSEQNVDEVLPHFPSGFDLTLAHEIVHHDLMTQFDELLSMVEDFNKEVDSVNEIFDYHSKKSGEYVELLRKHSGRLVNVLCNADITLADIPREKQHLETVIKSLESMPEISIPVIELLDRFARTLEDYKEVSEQAKRLGSGPSELSFHANPFHAKASVNNHLAEALAKHKELMTQASELTVIFYIERLGCVKLLKEAYESIYVNKDNWFRFFKKDYRKSKQLVKGVMRQPKSYSFDQDFFIDLERLIDYGEQRDLFAGTEVFSNSLGTLFKGIETDWVTLKKLIDFSQELRELVGIEKTKNILSDWDTHADRMENVRNKLNKAINCVKEYSLIHLLPKLIWKRPVNDISSTLRPWLEKLDSAVNAIVQPWCNTGATLERVLAVVETYKLARGKESGIIKFEHFETLLRPYWKGARNSG